MAHWERLFVGSIEPPSAGLRAGGDGFVQRFSDEVQRHVIVGGVSRAWDGGVGEHAAESRGAIGACGIVRAGGAREKANAAERQHFGRVAIGDAGLEPAVHARAGAGHDDTLLPGGAECAVDTPVTPNREEVPRGTAVDVDDVHGGEVICEVSRHRLVDVEVRRAAVVRADFTIELLDGHRIVPDGAGKEADLR